MKLGVNTVLFKDYSLREAFAAAALTGYDGVELVGFNDGGYFGLDAPALKAKLDELGLVCTGTHAGLDSYDGAAAEETIKYHRAIGCKIIGIGGAPVFDEDDLVETMDILGRANKLAEKEGMKVYFHNHTHEFRLTEDSSVEENIIDRLKEVCYLQLDTYWSFCAGVDNYKFITENKDRIVAVHVKDGIGGKTLALGEGNCDIESVIRAAKDIGLEWLVVENDDPSPDGVSDIARSIKYLKGVL